MSVRVYSVSLQMFKHEPSQFGDVFYAYAMNKVITYPMFLLKARINTE